MSAEASPATIMIIDDEPTNLTVLGAMLRRHGWKVRAFPDGVMALASAFEDAPDLVLLDVRMPGMDGYEVCRRFKEVERLRQIPIIFLSGFTEAADKVKAFESGGVDYVTKPFAGVEVLARVRLHLRVSRYQLHLEDMVKQRVSELAEAHHRLRIWDDAKSQWLDTLSHEMRTPLQGVFGVTELMFADAPKSPETDALYQGYLRSRGRILKLIDDAVTLTTIDVGAVSLTMKPAPVLPLLRDAVATVGTMSPHVPVTMSLEDAASASVLCQASLLDRAFVDLLLTGTRCVAPGEPVTVSARIEADRVHVIVETSGPQLPQESLETFFDVGGQRTLVKGGGDFGLGPALAHRIFQLFHGNVSVRNGDARGVVMEAVLPLATAAA